MVLEHEVSKVMEFSICGTVALRTCVWYDLFRSIYEKDVFFVPEHRCMGWNWIQDDTRPPHMRFS